MNAINRGRSKLGWLLLTVVVQAAIGAGMVPVRFLQTQVGLPGFALISLSDMIAFSIMSWQVIRRIEKRFWRSKTLWILVSIVVVRTIMQTFALRFTKAYIVQLINLLAPFVVVLLNKIFNKTPLPKNTLVAISFSLLGGGLMVLGSRIVNPAELVMSATDWVGVALAFLGTFGIAAYMIIVKRSNTDGLPFEVVYISQIGTMAVLMAILSLGFGEDWTPFAAMDWRAVIAFLSIAIGMEIGCKIGNIAVLRKLGAPLVSSMLALRLVAALLLGWFILGERLESGLQWIGAIIVVITITWYLGSQIRMEQNIELDMG